MVTLQFGHQLGKKGTNIKFFTIHPSEEHIPKSQQNSIPQIFKSNHPVFWKSSTPPNNRANKNRRTNIQQNPQRTQNKREKKKSKQTIRIKAINPKGEKRINHQKAV